MGKKDSNIRHYIALMKNECILNMLELKSIDACHMDNKEEINSEYLEKLIINSYFLRSFNPLCLPKGCLYAKTDAHRSLEHYWNSHQDIAKKTVQELAKALKIHTDELSVCSREKIIRFLEIIAIRKL
ncbi:MAG: hypothetical protein LBI69_00055 [Puniceicoccales bacterium]|jgi:hypothetical protein|nr:hypothetical protein [Puniceicoccales bacterium]